MVKRKYQQWLLYTQFEGITTVNIHNVANNAE